MAGEGIAIGAAANNMLTVAMMALILLFVIGLIGGGMYIYFWWKKYQQYNCIIFKEGKFIGKDEAGIFVDRKTKNKRFFLRKNKVGLNPNNVPYFVGDKGKKTVFLQQVGLKNFRYIDISLEPLNFEVGEEDVNWAIQDFELAKTTFADSLIMKLMPYISLILVSIIIVIIFMYFFKEFSTLKDVAIAFKEAAIALADAQTGTKVI